MVIAISASGVMSPGPLFAANVVYGLKEGKIAGIKMAVGHTVVEFPLIILLGIGVLSLDIFPEYRIWITLIGAIGLFCFAALQIKSIFEKNFQKKLKPSRNSFMAGIFFTGLNPFFLIWWFTIGFKLITDSIQIWGIFGRLTNNDLRLCAYLRLNLSSKEIAPLLNISLSSVDIKRYRLRKKMNLSRNQRLTDYLLTL